MRQCPLIFLLCFGIVGLAACVARNPESQNRAAHLTVDSASFERRCAAQLAAARPGDIPGFASPAIRGERARFVRSRVYDQVDEYVATLTDTVSDDVYHFARGEVVVALPAGVRIADLERALAGFGGKVARWRDYDHRSARHGSMVIVKVAAGRERDAFFALLYDCRVAFVHFNGVGSVRPIERIRRP